MREETEQLDGEAERVKEVENPIMSLFPYMSSLTYYIFINSLI